MSNVVTSSLTSLQKNCSKNYQTNQNNCLSVHSNTTTIHNNIIMMNNHPNNSNNSNSSKDHIHCYTTSIPSTINQNETNLPICCDVVIPLHDEAESITTPEGSIHSQSSSSPDLSSSDKECNNFFDNEPNSFQYDLTVASKYHENYSDSSSITSGRHCPEPPNVYSKDKLSDPEPDDIVDSIFLMSKSGMSRRCHVGDGIKFDLLEPDYHSKSSLNKISSTIIPTTTTTTCMNNNNLSSLERQLVQNQDHYRQEQQQQYNSIKTKETTSTTSATSNCKKKRKKKFKKEKLYNDEDSPTNSVNTMASFDATYNNNKSTTHSYVEKDDPRFDTTHITKEESNVKEKTKFKLIKERMDKKKEKLKEKQIKIEENNINKLPLDDLVAIFVSDDNNSPPIQQQKVKKKKKKSNSTSINNHKIKVDEESKEIDKEVLISQKSIEIQASEPIITSTEQPAEQLDDSLTAAVPEPQQLLSVTTLPTATAVTTSSSSTAVTTSSTSTAAETAKSTDAMTTTESVHTEVKEDATTVISVANTTTASTISRTTTITTTTINTPGTGRSAPDLTVKLAQGLVTFTDFESLLAPQEDNFQPVTSRKAKRQNRTTSVSSSATSMIPSESQSQQQQQAHRLPKTTNQPVKRTNPRQFNNHHPKWSKDSSSRLHPPSHHQAHAHSHPPTSSQNQALNKGLVSVNKGMESLPSQPPPPTSLSTSFPPSQPTTSTTARPPSSSSSHSAVQSNFMKSCPQQDNNNSSSCSSNNSYNTTSSGLVSTTKVIKNDEKNQVPIVVAAAASTIVASATSTLTQSTTNTSSPPTVPPPPTFFSSSSASQVSENNKTFHNPAYFTYWENFLDEWDKLKKSNPERVGAF